MCSASSPVSLRGATQLLLRWGLLPAGCCPWRVLFGSPGVAFGFCPTVLLGEQRIQAEVAAGACLLFCGRGSSSSLWGATVTRGTCPGAAALEADGGLEPLTSALPGAEPHLAVTAPHPHVLKTSHPLSGSSYATACQCGGLPTAPNVL